MILKRKNYFIIFFEIIFLQNVLSDCIIYYDNGTEFGVSEWTFGVYLPNIADDSPPTSLLSLKTKNVESIQYELNTNFQNYVNVNLHPDSYLISIELTDDFANYEENESKDLFRIRISLQCETGTNKDFVVNQGITDSNNHDPVFLNAPYECTIGMPIPKNYSLELDCMVIKARDIDISNKNVTFSLRPITDDSKGFSLLWSSQEEDNNSKSIFTSRLITTDLIDLSRDIQFKIFVQDTGEPVRETNTMITIKVNKGTSSLKFSQPMYVADCESAEVEQDASIDFDSKIIITRGAELNMTVDLASNPKGYENYFQRKVATNMSIISFQLVKPSVTLLNEKFIFLQLNVSKVRSSAFTVLFIKLPGLKDGILKPKLYFKKLFHRFEKDVSFTGKLMTEKAIFDDFIGNVDYSINYENIVDKEKYISIDPVSADVSVTRMISQGIYTFDIVAKADKYKLSANTKVLLIIKQKEIDYTLRMIEVEEESPHQNILNLGSEICSYTITSQTPDRDLFYVTKNTLNSKAIDRESNIFLNMTSAQVRLAIDISCPSEPSTFKRVQRDTEYNVILGNIPFKYSRMHVIAIITDINDNAPKWDDKTPQAIGYPAKELSKFILAPCVYNLSASDADIGENAVVTYSIKDNLAFYVHPNSGSLYTRLNAKVTDTVTVMASDGNQTSYLNISIKSLEVENVVILYVRNAVIEDIESFLSKIRNNLTNYFIDTLGAGVISNFETDLTSEAIYRNTNDRNTLLRILIYGLDVQSSMPLSQTNLISVLEAGGILNSGTILKVIALKHQEEEESSFLVIVTIVLGVCLGAILIAIMTVFICRNRNINPTKTKL